MSESGLPSPVSVSTLLVLGTILHGFGLTATSFRLWFRYHTRRLWWDDFWAALALVCDAVGMVAVWMFCAPLNDPYTNYEALPTPALSRDAHVVSAWLIVIFYTCTIWFARISIVCSVVRIVPPSRGVSIVTLGAGGAFFCMWVYMLACKTVVCTANKSWYDDSDLIRCPIPTWVAISEITTDALSDIVLVVFPLRLLWRVKLPSNQRIMVLSVFSTSILVSVVSAVHTAYIIPSIMFLGALTAELGGAVSLIVCNLLVIVTFVYRVIRNGRDLMAGLSDKHGDSSNRLTTVDLDYPGVSWMSQTVTEAGFASMAMTGMGDVTEMEGDGATLDSVAASDGSLLPSTSQTRVPIARKS